jgi:broad specificity phosphatase PhoE
MISEAASVLMLDLGITEKNHKMHRVMVVSSPFKKCLETAVLVCQVFGVDSFYVHFGVGENLINILQTGWDWGRIPLYLTSSEMHQFVNQKSRKGERRGKCKVRISGFLGSPMSAEDRGENQRDITNRFAKSFNEIKSFLEKRGDHMICVAHHDAQTHFARNYGEGYDVTNGQDCSFITFAMPSDNCAWVTGRSRINFIPK